MKTKTLFVIVIVSVLASLLAACAPAATPVNEIQKIEFNYMVNIDQYMKDNASILVKLEGEQVISDGVQTIKIKNTENVFEIMFDGTAEWVQKPNYEIVLIHRENSTWFAVLYDGAMWTYRE